MTIADDKERDLTQNTKIGVYCGKVKGKTGLLHKIMFKDETETIYYSKKGNECYIGQIVEVKFTDANTFNINVTTDEVDKDTRLRLELESKDLQRQMHEEKTNKLLLKDKDALADFTVKELIEFGNKNMQNKRMVQQYILQSIRGF